MNTQSVRCVFITSYVLTSTVINIYLARILVGLQSDIFNVTWQSFLLIFHPRTTHTYTRALHFIILDFVPISIIPTQLLLMDVTIISPFQFLFTSSL